MPHSQTHSKSWINEAKTCLSCDKFGYRLRMLFIDKNEVIPFQKCPWNALCKNQILLKNTSFYPPMKSEGYSFGCVRPFRPSVRTFCLSGTISQYLLLRFNSFLVQMISTMNSQYPISLVKIDPLTLELLPLFKYRQL